MEVKCPTCQKPVVWNSSSVYRPFCSERCRLIDLGEWASEGHVIPGRSTESEAPAKEWSQGTDQDY